MITTKTVLELEYTKLPPRIKTLITGWHGFGNDVVLPARMEVPVDQLNLALLEQFRQEDDGEQGRYETLEDYCMNYGYGFEYWLLTLGYDLSLVDDVYVNICW